jgi:hypothetical protein
MPLVNEQVSERVTSLTSDPQATLTVEAPQKHGRYYFPDGNVVFLVRQVLCTDLVRFRHVHSSPQVERRLYRVYRYPLERTSSIFASLFSLPKGELAGDREGAVDEHPIRLYGVPTEEFHVFLERIFSVFS